LGQINGLGGIFSKDLAGLLAKKKETAQMIGSQPKPGSSLARFICATRKTG
jgi:hypothetical protein